MNIDQSCFEKKLMFEYKNWKGEVNLRHVYPVEIRYGCTDWHPNNQWLMKAWDFAKGDYREFAMKDIISFH